MTDTAKFVLGPNQEAWLRDLETTTAEQRSGGHIDGERWCALSRAHAVFDIPPKGGMLTDYAKVSSFLGMEDEDTGDVGVPRNIPARVGRVWGLNDNRSLSFREIADTIRANPSYYFSRSV